MNVFVLDENMKKFLHIFIVYISLYNSVKTRLNKSKI